MFPFADAEPIVVDSTTGWIAALTAFAVTMGLVAQVILQIIARYDAAKVALQARTDSRRAQSAAVEAAVEAREVKSALIEVKEAAEVRTDKLDDIARTTEAIHERVDGSMSIQLRLNAATTRRLADLTRDPKDVEAADLAEWMYREHSAKQSSIESPPPGGKADDV